MTLLENTRTSVLREWVTVLPLREQGLLLTAIRGCDLAPKNPLDSPERGLTAYMRWLVCNPADEREVGSEPGTFMRTTAPTGWKPSAFEHYPMHWVTHIMHAYEVVAYRHPDGGHRRSAFAIYTAFVRAMHLHHESKYDMIARLSEDRIETGEVVS